MSLCLLACGTLVPTQDLSASILVSACTYTCASMQWFAVGIDPLLKYLERRLDGIPIIKRPVVGPANFGEEFPQPIEEKFILMAYCDDVKPSITEISDFLLVDSACKLLQNSSGCKLHRDPASSKCKFLLLGQASGKERYSSKIFHLTTWSYLTVLTWLGLNCLQIGQIQENEMGTPYN